MTVELKNIPEGKRAGDVEYFPSGHQTYLAPLPLPTSEHPFCPYISGYMEYELNDLSGLQDPLGLQEPGDPPHEGLHTFRNARAGLHRRLREKEVGRIYAFFWYVYHVMTLWTLPNRLVEWEIKRIAKVGRRALPPAMLAWSEPLPPEQWAKPSSELLRLSAKVKALLKRYPRTPITEVYAEVYRNDSRA